MRYKISVLLIILVVALSVGCAKTESEGLSERLVGDWKVVSIQCEEEDIKADVLAGNIVITLKVTETDMTITANDYTDLPIPYKIEEETIVFEDENIIAGFEAEGFTLETILDGHSYKYLLIKVEDK